MSPSPPSLTGRDPRVGPDRLLGDLAPPPRFADVRFSSYEPAPDQPTQAAAVRALTLFAGSLPEPRSGWRRFLGGSPDGSAGIYLDGGFGVGKTHLLASLWHEAPGPKAFGTFVEYTNLVGALGFRACVEALSGLRLVCIDEFELDDPGDTVLMARLLRELVDAGVRLGATSNTLPDALGEGRFDADVFRREIQAVAAHFDVVRVDGDDYRHRGLPASPDPLPDDDVARFAGELPGAVLDDFDALLDHLATVHPSRYGALLDGVSTVCWRGVGPLEDQGVALRLVVLADRLYERDLPLVVGGQGLASVFTAEMLAGGYRKKYRRALSRMTALARAGTSSPAT